MRYLFFLFSVLFFLPMFTVHAESKPGIAVLGDSYSDEYRFYPPSRTHSLNWVEFLANSRSVNFGSFSLRSRGEPRNQGYAFNWAEDGASSSDLIDSGQLSGVLDHIALGKVALVVIFVGGNNFLDGYEQSRNQIDSTAIGTTVISDITSTVTTLLTASSEVRVILVSLPNLKYIPAVKAARSIGFISQSTLDGIAAAEQTINDHLKMLADSDERVFLVDFASSTDKIFSRASFAVGGISINRVGTGDNYHNLFLNDGIHLGSVAQGLLANLILRTLREAGVQIRPFSQKEIIAIARRR